MAHDGHARRPCHKGRHIAGPATVHCEAYGRHGDAASVVVMVSGRVMRVGCAAECGRSIQFDLCVRRRYLLSWHRLFAPGGAGESLCRTARDSACDAESVLFGMVVEEGGLT